MHSYYPVTTFKDIYPTMPLWNYCCRTKANSYRKQGITSITHEVTDSLYNMRTRRYLMLDTAKRLTRICRESSTR